MGGLLADVRNYLDITYQDEETDKKLLGIIERGKAHLNNVAGREQDYDTEGLPRALLLDYCMYAQNKVLVMFDANYRPELISLKIGVQTDGFAEEGYV